MSSDKETQRMERNDDRLLIDGFECDRLIGCVQAIRAKVAEGGRVVSSGSMERMIDVAVEKVTKTCYDTEEDVDENIKDHISGVTQEFIDKVIEQIFDEMNADKD